MALYDKCPGTASISRPELLLVKCPKCGGEVEIFSDEEKVVCDNCGVAVFREKSPSCFDWCKYAEECKDELDNTGR